MILEETIHKLQANSDWKSLPLFDRTGWKRVRFGDVVRNVNSTEKNPLEAGIERFIGLEHLEPGSLHVKTWGNVADGTTFTRLCKPGQMLFGKRRAYQRKVAVADFDAVVSGDIYVFEPKGEELLPELLPFLCISDRFFEHAVGTSSGSLSPRTNWTSITRREPEKLMFVPEEARGMIRTEQRLRSTERLLRRIESVVGDLDDLESELAQSMRDFPTLERDVHRRYAHGTDMATAGNQILDRAFDLFSVRIHSGRIRPDLANLAQALLLNDEPWLILHSPAASNDSTVWPVDYELQRLVEAGTDQIKPLLVSALKSDLLAGTLILAGTITTYSTAHDIQLNLDHIWKRSPLLQRVPWISTIGGRSFPLYNGARFEPHAESQDKRFTFAAGGYGEFVHQQLEPYPALFWENELGWIPNPHNPLEYIAHGKRVAWYERRHGPLRDAINEPGYRQPQFSRWVVKEDAFQAAEKRLGGAFREISEFTGEVFR